MALIKTIAYYLAFAPLLFFISCQQNHVSYMDELRGIADQINRKCPQAIDSETRLDGIEVVEPNTLIYKYTLVNLLKEQVDTVAFKRALWPGLLSTIKVSRDMQKLRDNNTTAVYAYKDKNSVAICMVNITPKDYK